MKICYQLCLDRLFLPHLAIVFSRVIPRICTCLVHVTSCDLLCLLLWAFYHFTLYLAYVLSHVFLSLLSPYSTFCRIASPVLRLPQSDMSKRCWSKNSCQIWARSIWKLFGEDFCGDSSSTSSQNFTNPRQSKSIGMPSAQK